MLISEFCKFRMVFISSKLQTQNFLPLELFFILDYDFALFGWLWAIFSFVVYS